MARRRDGQELGDSFNDAEQNDSDPKWHRGKDEKNGDKSRTKTTNGLMDKWMGGWWIIGLVG
jgi:hypothetical protein